MGFIGVYRALYDYTPQAEGELTIAENDLLYVIEKNDDDGWWKAKKKAGAEDEEEPVGLVPHNYVEEARAVGHARALYEYTRQTDEELSFPEDAVLEVFDTSDADWILVGLEDDYGFVPANYIDMESVEQHAAVPSTPDPPALPARPTSASEGPASPVESASPSTPSGPAAALAGVMQGRRVSAQPASPPPPQPSREMPQFDDYHHASDEEPPVRTPTLPSRPRPSTEPTYTHHEPIVEEPATTLDNERTPGGFHMYNVNEMISVMGKKKKMPTTLGINLRTGMILIAPERAQDGPSQEWSADKMTHYSREGKHVFLELVRPSKSIDFHAGAKDTADEIIRGLGDMAGAVRAEGLKEVIMAGTNRGQKKGKILYDFMAQSEDEVTVAVGDEVVVVDDTKSEEWWQVCRLRNGKEGVVPSSYVEVTGIVTPPPSSDIDSVRSTVEHNRMEELRLTKEALRASKEPQQVGPGMTLPERGSSLNNADHKQGRRQNERNDGSSASKAKSKPDTSKVRTWTDRSRSFSVDAQFLGLKDGKIHLHKMNGVKIAVPIAKMSKDDLEYVENLTGISLHQEDKPQSNSRKRGGSPDAGAKTSKDNKPEYDWFQFFLSCDVAVGLCERYAQAFHKDSMDESVLPDIDATVLRTLGLREGDIIKVMRTLDAKYGRQKPKDGDGGLFSGPGGALRNNTRKGRPAPAVQTSDVVDASAFSKKDKPSPVEDGESTSPPASAASPSNGTATKQPPANGFDDDAWDVKPSKQPQQKAPATSQSPPQSSNGPPSPPAKLIGSMKDLSLLSEPLQPTKTASLPVPPAQAVAPTSTSPPPGTTQPQQGATPSFFQTLQQPQQTGMRQRPVPPTTSPQQGSLVPPPPQNHFSSQPTGMVPQMTGSVQSQVAPPGQSLSEMGQARLQQQQQQQYMTQLQPNYTGFPGAQPQGIMPMQTGPPGQFMQPVMTGAHGQGPFADPLRPNSFSPMQAQPTGYQPPFSQPSSFGQPPPGGINNYLPPALEPQKTGMPPMQPQVTGIPGFSQPSPQPGPQPGPQPLQPQQTGPAPPVRFGVSNEAKKLAPQATGRKANLAQATPQNPFGF